jgi:D-amino-acid dehydrogenase
MTESEDRSVIIVGAGIIGIACAHFLNRRGFNVTVIDQARIARGCSHGNCGYICPSHALPLTEPGAIRTALRSLVRPSDPFRIKPRFSLDLWNWLWQFGRRCTHTQMLAAGHHLQAILDSSMREYRTLMAEDPIDCDWTERGLLYVLRTDRALHEFAKTDQLLRDEFGVAATRLSGHDLTDFEPALKPGLAGAFHYPADVSVRPDRLNSNWAARLRQRGVRFIENCELTAVSKSNGHVTGLQTSHGPMTSRHALFAAGALSSRLASQLNCRIPIEPGKGYSVTMRRPALCPQHPMLFPEHRVGVSPFEDGYRLGSMMEFVGFDATIPARRIQQLRDSAVPYLREPYTDDVEEQWYGWRPMTWDSLPIIGQVPGLQNAWLATGHNMLGLTLAPATGRLIAELIENRPTHLEAAPFSPLRFE